SRQRRIAGAVRLTVASTRELLRAEAAPPRPHRAATFGGALAHWMLAKRFGRAVVVGRACAAGPGGRERRDRVPAPDREGALHVRAVIADQGAKPQRKARQSSLGIPAREEDPELAGLRQVPALRPAELRDGWHAGGNVDGMDLERTHRR